MLSVEGLDVRYGGINALRNLSVTVEAGETVILLGANGAGKSSLIKAIIGTVRPSAGTILFAGKPMDALSCDRRARAGVGYSPEGRHVFTRMSVADNVLSGGFGMRREQLRRSYDWLCATFPILAQRAKQDAGLLSGGEQQIVAFARALCAEPTLLLLDEPFLGLAPVWIQRISDAIREVQRRGTTILLTEQMARPALKLATRGYVMRGGEIRRSGTVAELRDAALIEEYL